MNRYQQVMNRSAATINGPTGPVKPVNGLGEQGRIGQTRTQLGEISVPNENLSVDVNGSSVLSKNVSVLNSAVNSAKKRPLEEKSDVFGDLPGVNVSLSASSYRRKRRTVETPDCLSACASPERSSEKKSTEDLIAEFEQRIAKWSETELITEDRLRYHIPCAMSDYAEHAMRFLVGSQSRTSPGVDCISRQSDLTPKMREILIDWIIDIHAKFSLRSESLHLTVPLLDCFLTVEKVPRSQLQLAGVTALFIATKVEEIFPPEVGDFAFVTDNSCSVEMILAYEVKMLNALNFDVSIPTSFRFLDRLVVLADMSGVRQHKLIAQCLLELQLVDVELSTQWTPLQRACAAVYLTRRVLRVEPSWPNSLKQLGDEFPEASLVTIKRCARCVVPLLDIFNKGNIAKEENEEQKKTETEEKEESKNKSSDENQKKSIDNFQALRRKFSSRENGQITKLFASLM